MTRFRQSAIEVIAAIAFIALGTLIVHLILSWWSRINNIALAACSTKLDEGGGKRRGEGMFIAKRYLTFMQLPSYLRVTETN